MNNTLQKILLATALAASLVALVVSITHKGPSGPPGPQGPQGQTGRNAEVAHLGMCFDVGTDSSTGDVAYVLLTSPLSVDGVPSCPSGSFVSIVPQPPSSSN